MNTAIAVRPEVIPAKHQDLGRNPAAVYLARLAPGSRPAMRGALAKLATLLEQGTSPLGVPWWQLEYQHVAALRSRLAEHYSPATVNRHLAALRGVLKESWRLGLMPGEQYRQAVDVDNIKAQVLPAGRALPAGEIAAMISACLSGTTAGTRDAAMVAVLFACGLRRAELVDLDVTDYDPAGEVLRVRSGKGRKDREIPIVNGAKRALDAWMEIRDYTPGALFVAMVKGGRLTGRRLTPQSVLKMLRGRARQAGIEHLSPHDFRRTFITELLEQGADTFTVQKLAGHANPQTTARYDRRDDKAKRQAVARLHVPYPA